MALIQAFGNIDSEIEILFESDNQPWFKRADFGRFLGLKDIRTSIPDDMKGMEQKIRSELQDGGSSNRHDNFISIKLALLIAMRSTKAEAVQARDWIISEVIPRGFNKIINEKQKALGLKQQVIDSKNIVIALLNDNISTLIKSMTES